MAGDEDKGSGEPVMVKNLTSGTDKCDVEAYRGGRLEAWWGRAMNSRPVFLSLLYVEIEQHENICWLVKPCLKDRFTRQHKFSSCLRLTFPKAHKANINISRDCDGALCVTQCLYKDICKGFIHAIELNGSL